MTALVGGLVAVALGLIGLGMWYDSLFVLIKGGLPLLLLLGGALARDGRRRRFPKLGGSQHDG